MKIHLVSIIIHGITYSGFMAFHANQTPSVDWETLEAFFSIKIPRGTTVTIG